MPSTKQVEVLPQVYEFLRTLAPAPRRRLRLGISGLKEWSGDIKALEGELQGFWRLRVASYRVIFAVEMRHGIETVRCLFAERRSVVYELFARILNA